MTDHEYLESLQAALSRATEQQEREELLAALDRVIEQRLRRTRSVPDMERR